MRTNLVICKFKTVLSRSLNLLLNGFNEQCFNFVKMVRKLITFKIIVRILPIKVSSQPSSYDKDLCFAGKTLVFVIKEAPCVML